MSSSEPPASSISPGSPGDAWPRRILVVARWYPSHDDPGSGSFVSDEVVALRAAGIDVVVASWENADLRARDVGTDSAGRQAVEAWTRAVVEPAALSTPSAWGAGVPVARIPAVHPGGRLPARAAVQAHGALLVPFATARAARWPFDMIHAHVGIPDGAAAAAAPSGMPTCAWIMSNGHLAARAVANGTRSAPCAWIAARAGRRPPGWTAGIRATGTPAPQALGVDSAAGSTTARVQASTACRPAESVPTSRARRSAFSQDATTTSIPAARNATTSSLTKLPLPGSSWDGYHLATTRMRRGQASPGEPGEIDEA